MISYDQQPPDAADAQRAAFSNDEERAYALDEGAELSARELGVLVLARTTRTLERGRRASAAAGNGPGASPCRGVFSMEPSSCRAYRSWRRRVGRTSVNEPSQPPPAAGRHIPALISAVTSAVISGLRAAYPRFASDAANRKRCLGSSGPRIKRRQR